MAKKKNKKTQKQVDWTSPPDSPKPAPEPPVPVEPASPPLSKEDAPLESTQADPVQPSPSPIEAKIDETAVEVPTPAPTTEETTPAEQPSPAEQKEQKAGEKVAQDIDPSLEKTTSNQPVISTEPEEAQSTEEPPAGEQGVEEPKEEPSSKDPPTAPEPAPSDPQAVSEAPEPETKEPVAEPASVEAGETVSESIEVPEETAIESSTNTVEPVSQPEPASSVEAPPPQPTTEVAATVESGSEPEPEPASVSAPASSVETPPQPKTEVPATVESGFKPSSSPAPAPVSTQADEAVAEPKADPSSASPAAAAEVEPQPLPSASEKSVNYPSPAANEVPKTRSLTASPRPKSPLKPPPKPAAVNQIVEDNRPPAPSPPVGRSRPRHSSAFDNDDDDDDDDSALVHPRHRAEALSRDPSRGSTYPPQSRSRSLFASRVPVEHYPNPPPPPPPNYHRGYYPLQAPPYYHSPSYSMSQSGYSNANHYAPPSHASPPYQDAWSQYPPSLPPHGSPQRHDSLGPRDYPLATTRLEDNPADGDAGDLVTRVVSAIPDIHVLLARFQETHGQLGVREELLRRADVEQQAKLKAKDEEIQGLKERADIQEDKHSGETSRFRLEIGNLEEQIKDLKEQVSETERFKKEAHETKLALDAAVSSREGRYKELEQAHSNLEQTAMEEKMKAQKEFEEWKATVTTKHDAEKIALAIQFDKKLKEADVNAENLRQEAAEAFVKEKDDLKSEYQRQQRELEAKLNAAQKEREEAFKHERQSRELWSTEREALLKSHQEDRDSLRRGWDEQRNLLEGQYKKAKDESDKAWIELHAEANRKAEEEKAKSDQLTKEGEELLKKYNELKAESEKEKGIIKSVAGNLESEKVRLEKLMECYGDIAEIKSKGDTYYLVSFSQLQKQIIDLASTHFVHLPVTPPAEDLAAIPSGLPSFLGDTEASRQLRSAYVAHTVAKMITYRVFGPFLFSLGRRYDKADSLFSSMSNHIRDKSIRKEAIWRQQTLLAAFTSSGAKQRINTAAGTVVDEIVNAIKNFADPKEEEAIKIAVKRIVKLAAETWRFARLEREMITATMPALHDDAHNFIGPEYWPAYKADGTPIASLAGTAPPSNEQPKLLLRLFPVITREPKHEVHRNSEEETPDEGCIYHHGLALYDDAEPVVQRSEELRAAGLPPVITASPSVADFPPPLIAPPRNPPPSPPAMSDKPSTKTKSRRTSAPSEKTASVRSKSPPPGSVKAASTRSKSPPPPSEKATSTRSKSPPPPSEKAAPTRSKSPPPPSEKITSTRTRSLRPSSDKAASAKLSVSPQPPLASTDHSSSPKQNSDDPHVSPYTRPPPGPIDYSTPHEAPPILTTPRSVIGPRSDYSRQKSNNEDFLPMQPENEISPAPEPKNRDTNSDLPVQTPLAPNESFIIPPIESTSKKDDAESGDLPTPPHSRSSTPPRPVSPLLDAIDEIEELQPPRSRASPTSRRSTRSKPSLEEPAKDRPEMSRRVSGYALSTNTRSSIPESQRTERTEESKDSKRSSSSRYMCESRSAAIKALYPNSPLAGQSPNLSRANSMRNHKPRERAATSSIPDNGTWDTNSQSQTSNENNDDPSTV